MKNVEQVFENIPGFLIEENLGYKGATPQLSALDAFAGHWKTKGIVYATEHTGELQIKGYDSYYWLKGGHFMIHQADVMIGNDRMQSIEIIRYDAFSGKYLMHYYGTDGGTGKMKAECEGRSWNFYSDSEEFCGKFSEDGRKISGTWKRLLNNEWVKWMEVELVNGE